MLIDDTIVQQVLRVKKAYPSLTISEITAEVNKFFSREETFERVKILSKSIKNGDSLGKLLYRYYPLLLFNCTEYKNDWKIILDKRNIKLLEFFKAFCLEFGISSHLKKHGGSQYKLFRLIPRMSDLNLKEVWLGMETPKIGWDPCWDYLCLHHLETGDTYDKITLPQDKVSLIIPLLPIASMRFNEEKYKSVRLFNSSILLEFK